MKDEQLVSASQTNQHTSRTNFCETLIWNRTNTFLPAAPTGCTSARLQAQIKTQRAQLIQELPQLCTPTPSAAALPFPAPPTALKSKQSPGSAQRWGSDLQRSSRWVTAVWGFYFEGRGACMSTSFTQEKQQSERRTVEEAEDQRPPASVDLIIKCSFLQNQVSEEKKTVLSSVTFIWNLKKSKLRWSSVVMKEENCERESDGQQTPQVSSGTCAQEVWGFDGVGINSPSCRARCELGTLAPVRVGRQNRCLRFRDVVFFS